MDATPLERNGSVAEPRTAGVLRWRLKRRAYHDSLQLMQAHAAAETLPGVLEAACIMATPLNRELLAAKGLLPPGLETRPDDLLVVVRGEDSDALDRALAALDGILSPAPPAGGAGLHPGQPLLPRTLDGAVRLLEGANLALISVPGAYAAAQAERALRRGLHVHLFSDNVAIEDEVALKGLACERGLLLMGPDCGTAILNGAPLGFANAVRRGPVGIVGASGTGVQQASVLVDRGGVGLSHAIGVGGRDLSEPVGGLMTLAAIDLLERDEATRAILLVSKPPAPAVLPRVLARIRTCRKPVVACFLGGVPQTLDGVQAGATIEESVALVARHVGVPIDGPDAARADAEAARAAAGRLREGQRYVRGLFAGGSLADEAMLVLGDLASPIHSNVPIPGRGLRLADASASVGHTIVDLGDDEFTQGRPHPMIDPSQRDERLAREARDPEVAVILCDVVLGYGAHPDPAGALARAVRTARAAHEAAAAHRGAAAHTFPSIVAFVCGTNADPQSLQRQEATLREADIGVFPTNAQAARAAAGIARLQETVVGVER